MKAAYELFLDNGLSGVSIAQIADAAECFPSQVTYYFGDKQGLFVDCACKGILVTRSDVERAACQARDPAEAVTAMSRAALSTKAVLLFVEAMLLARQRQDLQPRIGQAFEALHSEAARAASAVMAQRGWSTPAGAAVQSRAFWSAIIGVALEQSAAGDAFDYDAAEAAVRAVLHFD